MVKALTITVLATFAASAYAATVSNPHYLCGCFQPDFDYGCCSELKGVFDGLNSCALPHTDAKLNAFSSCCKKIGGKETKCKTIYSSDP
ncbi:hypothetical protein K450DRAFT_219338 [Umbelopsis ramanniana AG]|uniref:Uncharacterized protein n=1 Tax=Umbelopsis ramanniana AG TaxID=1314678 RepID=A0AAD5EI67_UMBRA|nr:uncharacterized protein K450DRAFT_219338 [Umbelopsis ramanniana AG]KAI8584331.1 hypothetical protein K450DRAFT_219338 [Umbelopsis ramanniana AG]